MIYTIMIIVIVIAVLIVRMCYSIPIKITLAEFGFFSIEQFILLMFKISGQLASLDLEKITFSTQDIKKHIERIDRKNTDSINYLTRQIEEMRSKNLK